MLRCSIRKERLDRLEKKLPVNVLAFPVFVIIRGDTPEAVKKEIRKFQARNKPEPGTRTIFLVPHFEPKKAGAHGPAKATK